MSKASRIICEIVSELAPSLEVSDWVAYKRGFFLILRGFGLEYTAYRNSWDIRNVYGTFFRQRSFLHLNYSPRILNSAVSSGQSRFVGTRSEVVKQARSAIEAAIDLKCLDDDSALHDLYENYSTQDAKKQPQIEKRLDMATFAFLAGREREAEDLFVSCADWFLRFQPGASMRKEDWDYLEEVKATIGVGLKHPERFRTLIRHRVHANATILGFKPAPLDD